MYTSPFATAHDDWSRPSYSVRVRPPSTPAVRGTFLWGSNGITAGATFVKPLVLHIRNDVFGEQITISTQMAATPAAPAIQTQIGTLQPGECLSIPLPQGISGVFATCGVQSTVFCLIKGSE